jgi:hypothetical protein
VEVLVTATQERPTAEGAPIEAPGCGEDCLTILIGLAALARLAWRWLR